MSDLQKHDDNNNNNDIATKGIVSSRCPSPMKRRKSCLSQDKLRIENKLCTSLNKSANAIATKECDNKKRKSMPMNCPRMNLAARQRLNCTQGHLLPSPVTNPTAGEHLPATPKAKNPQQKLSPVPATNGQKNSRVLKTQQIKLEKFQSEFLAQVRNLGKPKDTFKLVSLIVNDECNFIVNKDAVQKLPKNLPAQALRDLKDRCYDIIQEGFQLLDEQISRIQSAKDEQEATEIREELYKNVQHVMKKKYEQIASEIDLLNQGFKESSNPLVKRLFNDLQNARSQKRLSDEKLNRAKKDHCKEMKNIQNDMRESFFNDVLEMKKKFQSNMTALEQQIEEQTHLLEAAPIPSNDTKEMNLLKSTNKSLQNRMDELNASLRFKMERISNLENELQSLHRLKGGQSQSESQMIVEDATLSAKDQIIADLKQKLANLEKEKILWVSRDAKQQPVDDNLQGQLDAAHDQINTLQNQTQHSTEEHQRLQEDLKHCKERLTKAEQLLIQQQEQSIRDNQLLQIRCEMINTLQQHDQDNRNKIDHMYYQLNEKSIIINQVNNELSSRNEEFRNLFGTLGTKQMELRRHENVIKLLEENNTRNAMLRLKQEEKNSIMQDEIKQLKCTIHGIMLGSETDEAKWDPYIVDA